MHNHLEVVLPSGDYRDDAMLTTVANNRCSTLNISVPNSVEATAENGNLTLTGTVSYGAERDRGRGRAVAGLTGVRNLSDDIMIRQRRQPGRRHRERAGRPGPLCADPRRQRRDGGHRRGLLILSGHVRTWAEHDAVVDAAWMAVGVYDVRDNLYVTG